MKNNFSFLVFAVSIGIIVVIGLVVVVGVSNLGSGSTPLAGRGKTPVSLEDLLNKPAPQFSLSDLNGKVYSNETLRGKNVILFFNEGLRCYPACWNQMVSLGQDERFKTGDTVAFSVVMDPKDEWQKANSKVSELRDAVVLFDPEGVVSQEFGMLNAPSSMHLGNLPGHSYVILDKYGIVRFVLDDPRMGIQNDQLAKELGQQAEIRL